MAELNSTTPLIDIASEDLLTTDTNLLTTQEEKPKAKPASTTGMVQMAPQEETLSKEELAKKFISKPVQVIEKKKAEPVSTAVKKPVEAKVAVQDITSKAGVEGNILIPGSSIKQYESKQLESLLKGKGPGPQNVKYELSKFAGKDATEIDLVQYDKQVLKDSREEAKKFIENEFDAEKMHEVNPSFDYVVTPALQFLSNITPNALKSGGTMAVSGLSSLLGLGAKYFEDAKKEGPIGAAAAAGVEKEPATKLQAGEYAMSDDLFKLGQRLSNASEKYMMVAEMNSGIKDENIGKSPVDLLTSYKPGDAWDGMKKLGLSVLQQLPQLAAISATGGTSAGVFAGSAALSTGEELGQVYKEDKAISNIKAVTSVIKGVIEGAVETLFMGDIQAVRKIGGSVIKSGMTGAKSEMKNYLVKRGRKALEEQINRTYFQALGKTLKNSLGEGGEEVITAVGKFIVDAVEKGEFDDKAYKKLISDSQNGFLIGMATAGAVSGPVLVKTIEKLTPEQKDMVNRYSEIANDTSLSEETRNTAKKQADDIIKYNADKSAKRYALIASLPIQKRSVAIDILGKVQALQQDKGKVKNVDTEAQIDKNIKDLNNKFGQVILDHAIETQQEAQKEAEAKAKEKADNKATRLQAGESAEVMKETVEIDSNLPNTNYDLFKGKTKEQLQAIANLNAAMQSIDPDAKMVFYADADAMYQGLVDSGLSAKEAREKAYGNAGNDQASGVVTENKGYNPIVHINNEIFTEDTIGHEVGHVALMKLANENPAAFIEMRDRILGLMKDSQSKPLVDFANSYGRDINGELLQNDQANQSRAEEFITQMIGAMTAGDAKIEQTLLQQIALALRDFLLAIADGIQSPSLRGVINSAFANTTSGEELVKYFEGLAQAFKTGGKVDVSYLKTFVPLTPTQESRMQGLTPGSEAYHEAQRLNAIDNHVTVGNPTMEADQSLPTDGAETTAKSQIKEGNFSDSQDFKKFLRVVKGMEDSDLWMGQALAREMGRNNNLFAAGDKDTIIEKMQKEMEEIEADANNSDKYYLNDLKPWYIDAQIKKYSEDPRYTDNLTQWKQIKDNDYAKEQYIKQTKEIQKTSLLANIGYLKGNNTYSIPFQYIMIKDSIANRYSIEVDENENRTIIRSQVKASQYNSTENPIPNYQSDILPTVYFDYADKNAFPGEAYFHAFLTKPKIEVENSEFKKYINKESRTGEGYWLKFKQSNDAEEASDLNKITSTSHKYPAKWCTGGTLGMAKSHLKGGDFYVFVDNKTGDARIAVRYRGEDKIDEVRGLGEGQALLPNDNKILDEIVETFPDGESFKKDSEIQDKLKEILDSLPDEMSKKRFILNENQFDDWWNEKNGSISSVIPAERGKDKIKADEKILNAVYEKIVKPAKSLDDVLGFIQAQDRSYQEQNFALRKAKDIISDNLGEYTKDFGYGEGQIIVNRNKKNWYGQDPIQLDFNKSNFDNLRLIIGDSVVIGSLTTPHILFPNLEKVIGEISLTDFLNVEAPLLKSVGKIKLPEGGEHDFELNLPSLEYIGDDRLEISHLMENRSFNLNLPKLKSFSIEANAQIPLGSKINVPSLETLKLYDPGYNESVELEVYGEFHAPNLKESEADLGFINLKNEDFNISNLEKSGSLKADGTQLDLPKLKNIRKDGSLWAYNEGSIKLNEIEFSQKSNNNVIASRYNSSISINKIFIPDRGGEISIDALGNSEIFIGNAEKRNSEWSLGIRYIEALQKSRILIPQGLTDSNLTLKIEDKSQIILDPTIKRIKKVSVENGEFNSPVKDISTIELFGHFPAKLNLPNLEYLSNLDVYSNNGVIDTPNLWGISTLTTKNVAKPFSEILKSPKNTTIGTISSINSVLNIPNIRYAHFITLENSELTVPDLKDIALTSKSIRLEKSKLIAPSLETTDGPIDLLDHSRLNAPNLEKLGGENQMISSDSKVNAPLLGYNNTSTPSGDVTAKAQMSRNASEASKALSKASGTTQVATTTGSYVKAADILKNLGVTGNILDYGAGFGLGTDAMSKVLGKGVKSLEINPENWKGKGKVTYTDAKDIKDKFDGIVSLNVVNVVEKDMRDFIVKNIFDNLNIGGTAVISSRKFKGDIDQAKNFELGPEDKSYIIKRAKDGKTVDVYQKGFEGDELVNYVKGLLGDSADVKKNNTFGAAGVVVTKKSEVTGKAQQRLAPNAKPSNLSPELYYKVRSEAFKNWFGDWENDPENASKMLDENGEPQVFYHGTDEIFNEFDPTKKRYNVHNRGIFFTPSFKAALSYGDIVKPVFLNAKTVEEHVADKSDTIKTVRIKENQVLDNTDKEGVILFTNDKEGINIKQYVVFNPDQILDVNQDPSSGVTAKAQLFGKKNKYEPGTNKAKKFQKDSEKTSLSEISPAFQKELTERNVNIQDFLQSEGMAQSLYNMYNKAGATPWATRMFADAHSEIYEGLSKAQKGWLDDIILLERTIAIDTNFDERRARKEKVDGVIVSRPNHTLFTDYETGTEFNLSKEGAEKQIKFLEDTVYEKNPKELEMLKDRAKKYFKAFSDILKYKYDNGLIDQQEYDMYKNYNYQPRIFLKFLLGDTPASSFNTRGVQITKEEIRRIKSGDEGYMMTDSEKLLKMGFVSAVNKVFTNRAVSWLYEEGVGKNLSWLKDANIEKYADGRQKINVDGSPKILDPDTGFRNMFFKKDGKRYAIQLKEDLAREFQDEEMWDTRNFLYRAAVKVLGAQITSAMAVGINPAFVLGNIPVDLLSQVYYNNLYSSKFGVFGQTGKGLAGVLANSFRLGKAKTKLGDNSRVLNLIKEYGEAGGLMNTLTYDSNFLGKVGDALGIMGDISELGSKLTAYENRRNDLIKEYTKKNNTNPVGLEFDKIKTQAAYEARSAMDFHRGGRTVKFLNGFLPFFNVTFQVGKITTSYIKNNFPAFTKKMMQSGAGYAALTLYNMMVAGPDWENEDIKNNKRTKLIIMDPFKNEDGTHSYTKIQVPTPIKAFWNVFQTIAEAVYYEHYAPAMGIKPPEVDKDYADEMMQTLKMFVPIVTSQEPPSAKFFHEYNTNRSLWTNRSLSQDNLKNIIITEEGEENPDILSFYKLMAKGAANITKDQIEVSPERFQKASEDSFLTSPESQALLSAMYTVADQMTNLTTGGVDDKIKSKYVEGEGFKNVLAKFLGTFKSRLRAKTDNTKNASYYDAAEDKAFIERLNRIENSKKQNVSNKIKTIFKSYKELDLPYTEAKKDVSDYYMTLNKDDKEYAKGYIDMMLGRSKVELSNNIPKYLLIKNEAKTSHTKAMAIYTLFTLRGQDPMTNKTLQKDLGNIGFGTAVVKQYKQILADEKKIQERNAPKEPTIDPKTGYPEGFDPNNLPEELK
jgi:hypothetical protein